MRGSGGGGVSGVWKIQPKIGLGPPYKKKLSLGPHPHEIIIYNTRNFLSHLGYYMIVFGRFVPPCLSLPSLLYSYSGHIFTGFIRYAR